MWKKRTEHLSPFIWTIYSFPNIHISICLSFSFNKVSELECVYCQFLSMISNLIEWNVRLKKYHVDAIYNPFISHKHTHKFTLRKSINRRKCTHKHTQILHLPYGLPVRYYSDIFEIYWCWWSENSKVYKVILPSLVATISFSTHIHT